ncbi:MAG: 2-C-methyl-D-erythritol 4-phosphate cytidylyltransferase [Eubacteriales bacterium]|nr:2-C-methyl-D-erythritol 4-phosphate cytidylyltransferase [Eubacteriales bacterium]MDY3332243.1 2-C-methyl-D-erythritol 4-phosphate cytidylyltransferase [Gallibacter sp.]
MFKNRRTTAVIVAAGSGKRMGAEVAKQFLVIDDVPMIIKTLRVFISNRFIDDIVLVIRKQDKKQVTDLLSKYLEKDKIDRVSLVIGGNQRTDSVKNALKFLKNKDADIVLIHDVARPYITDVVIENVLQGLVDNEAVIPCVTPKDTIRTKEFTLDRDSLFIVQTPQGFAYKVIVNAYANMKVGNTYTDDASVVEASGLNVAIVEGSYKNIKITTIDDL